MEPGASLSLWGAGLRLHVCGRLAGQLEEIHRLDGFRIVFHSSCRNRSEQSGNSAPNLVSSGAKLKIIILPVFLLLRVQ